MILDIYMQQKYFTDFRFSDLLTVLPDEDSECEPPDPIPNSEVKPLSADGSVGFPHVRVGHRQALNTKPPIALQLGVFLYEVSNIIDIDTT